jgi:hypothetical protein
MKNDLKIYADKVIRSHNSFIPLFDYFYHNPKPDEASRVLMRAYHYKAQLFGWYSQSTYTVINSLHSIVGIKSPSGFPSIRLRSTSTGEAVRLSFSVSK